MVKRLKNSFNITDVFCIRISNYRNNGLVRIFEINKRTYRAVCRSTNKQRSEVTLLQSVEPISLLL